MSAPARRAHILDMTETLLIEVGIGGLTMRKIAAAAGISLGNLQYHFATREDVLLAVLVRFLEPYEQRFEKPPEHDAGTIVEALKPIYLETLTRPDFDACATIYKEVWAASSHSLEMRDALLTYYRRLNAFHRNVLRTFAAPGTPHAKIERAAAAMLPVLEGYCITKEAVDVPAETLAEDWAKMAAAILT